MKYRAVLNDPGNTAQERPVQTFANSLEVINTWAYGEAEGLHRARGVLETAKSPDAYVDVFLTEEHRIAIWTKRGKPE